MTTDLICTTKYVCCSLYLLLCACIHILVSNLLLGSGKQLQMAKINGALPLHQKQLENTCINSIDVFIIVLFCLHTTCIYHCLVVHVNKMSMGKNLIVQLGFCEKVAIVRVCIHSCVFKGHCWHTHSHAHINRYSIELSIFCILASSSNAAIPAS